MKKCCVLVVVVAVLVWSSGAFAELSITGDFASGKVAEYYSSVVALEGYEGGKLYHWELTKGKLPDGLSTEDAGMGILIHSEKYAIRLKGRPEKAGMYTFTFRVYDVEDPSDYAEKEFSVVIEENLDLPAPEIKGTFPASGTIGKPYRGTIEAQNGRLPYEWDYDENLLPDGLRMKEMLNDTTKLELSGVPEKNGEYKFTVTVTDVYGMSASQEVSIVIGDGSDPTPINPDPVSPDPTPINPDPVSPDPTPINPDPVSPDPTPINPDPVSPDPTPTPVSSSGGGGGCNSGFGVLILAALVLKRSR